MTALTATPLPHRASSPPRLYAWDVTHAGHAGEGGVTDDRGRAVEHVQDILIDAEPGTVATIRRVTLPASGRVEYLELGIEAAARRDELTGAIVWTAA